MDSVSFLLSGSHMLCSDHTDEGRLGSVYENQLKLAEVTLCVLLTRRYKAGLWEQMGLLM